MPGLPTGNIMHHLATNWRNFTRLLRTTLKTRQTMFHLHAQTLLLSFSFSLISVGNDGFVQFQVGTDCYCPCRFCF